MNRRRRASIPAVGLILPVVLFYLAKLSPAQAERPMELTVCSVSHDDKDADSRLDLLKQLGVTSIQTYISWNKIEKEPGLLDWSEYDADVALFKKHGLKWVPFIIAGPWYVTPEFVRKDPGIVMLRCLEHGRESAIPSIWSLRLRDFVRTYLRKFAEHFGPMNVLESVNIGVSGDYGEAIFSVLGNWPGEYHSHAGYWCGDLLAAADFRRAMKVLYHDDLAALNRSWDSGYSSFEDLAPFLPEKAPSERAWQEFLRWYRGAMTNHVEFWMAAARSCFPDTEIYLCTGGDMTPEHGSDFSAQAQVAAKHQGGIRITNEASSFPHNVRLTRLVGTACRFYGAYFGHEPASTVTPIGMLGRLFNAFTSGARQLFLYNTPELIGLEADRVVVGEGGRFQLLYKDMLRKAIPVIETGLFFPTPVSRQTARDREAFGDLAAEIRRAVDYDFLDERLIQEGGLAGKTVLIMAGTDALEARTIEHISAWVSGGGILFALGCRPVAWDDDVAAFDRLVGLTPASDEIQGITELVVNARERLASIAALSSVFVARAFKDIAPDTIPLLSMRYTDKGRVAWTRPQGKGRVYAYYGPMDIEQDEESWVVAQNLPLRFLKDGLRDAAREGVLKSLPLSLNLDLPDIYFAATEAGLAILNMGPDSRKIVRADRTVEIAGASILLIKK
jgi:hypothetical protein